RLIPFQAPCRPALVAGFFIPTFTTYFSPFYAKPHLETEKFSRRTFLAAQHLPKPPAFTGAVIHQTGTGGFRRNFVAWTCEVLRFVQNL
ncbi:MAG TPA: hypothetical protein PK958_13780, partial [Rhodocyclaceae bacterium]|nr:hypothetical protein [Rhodocyclaceae bacterium]